MPVALLAALIVLAIVAWVLARTSRRVVAARRRTIDLWRKIFVERWPAWIGGAIVGVLGTAAYLRVGPLGVTAEIGGRAAAGGHGARYRAATAGRSRYLARLHHGGARCRAQQQRRLHRCAGGGGLCRRVARRTVQAVMANRRADRRAASTGGALLGWGAMTGLGCTVGTFLSGVSAGALSGWVFGAAIFAGVFATLFAGRRIGLLA